MAAKHVEETAKENSTGFGMFKVKLADILTEEHILQLATFFHYPPAKIGLLQTKDSRNHLMVQYMEERGQITDTDITTLLSALKVLTLDGIQKTAQTLFELHTGKRCIGDDQSMQQQKDQTGNLDLGSKGSSTSVSTSLVLESFSSADRQNIILENGDSLPVSSTLEDLQIRTDKGKEFTQEQVIGLLSYGTQCRRLINLSFMDCLLPLSFSSDSLSSIPRLLSIEVQWKPSDPGLHLDCIRGKWISNSKEATTLETKGQNSLQLLCSSTVYLKKTDSKQLQRSTILLLEIASSHNISISHLYLQWSFSGFDGKDIRLESGLSLSSLSSVEKISINAGKQKQEFSEEEVIGLINYGIKSPRFKKLWLHYCKLPSSIKPDIIPEESRSRNIKVISSNEALYLDLRSGQWRKPDDIQTITEMCSGVLVIHRDTSESVKRSVIELLVKASNHDIPIHSVRLAWSFSKIDEDGNIILSSGLSLPIITSIKRMHIQTEEGREMNKHEVNGILNYVQHSQRFKELRLSDCLLPSSIPVGPSLSTLKSRGTNVFWIPDYAKFDEQYELDLGSGCWQDYGESSSSEEDTDEDYGESSSSEDDTDEEDYGESSSSEDDTDEEAPGPSSVTQPSTTAGRSTAGISASDRVVTLTTIQGLSEELCHIWKTVGRKLGLGEQKLEAIATNNIMVQEKVYQMLLTWKRSNGKEATCGLLGEALQSAGRKDLQEYVYQQGCSTESEKA